MVRGYRDWLLESRYTPEQRLQALQFFFSDIDDGDITFDQCCAVLRVRSDVLRMRFQYEWWLRGTEFTGPFSFSTVPVPKSIEGEICYYGGACAYALAREAWVQPGISESELIQYVCDDSYGLYKPAQLMAGLAVCQERFILSKVRGWYLTGRNPMLMNMRIVSKFGKETSIGGSFYWSALFANSD